MMIRDYEPACETVRYAVTHIGMSLRESDAFSAEFGRPDGWRVLLTGDKYVRPLIDLSIHPPLARNGFSLRILMSVHAELHGQQGKPPSLMNQLEFLVAHIDGWLAHTSLYEERYREINDAPWRASDSFPGRSM